MRSAHERWWTPISRRDLLDEPERAEVPSDGLHVGGCDGPLDDTMKRVYPPFLVTKRRFEP